MLIFFGLLCTDVLLADDPLPPLLAPLLEVPTLQIVDDSDMIVLMLVPIRCDPLVGGPEMQRGWWFRPMDADYE